MTKRLLTNNKCPICGEAVEVVQDSILKKNPGVHNTEFVVTKRGVKQYIHRSCWYGMIKNKKPYNGKMYV